MKKLFIFVLFVYLFILSFLSYADTKEVYVIPYSGIISPISSKFILSSIEKAEEENAYFVVLELDTPGGLDSSMREIIKKILNAKIPIIVYVYPKGGRAASAGVFITLASHIAAMAPGTNIGAAHPVSLMGKPDESMEKKIVNDAVAYIRSIAKERGRNEDWAEKAVKESVSVSAEEALSLGVIDYIAEDLSDLFKKINNREVSVNNKKVILNTEDIKVKYIKMSFVDLLFKYITNPNIAYILFFIGFYGIIGELSNPGSILPGVIGVISLILAFAAFQALPINYGGMALIIFGVILFIVEIFTPTFGAFTLGGLVSLVIGSLMLSKSNMPFLRISLQVIIPMVFTTLVFFIFIIGKAIKIQFKKPSTGKEGLIGETGIAKEDLDPEGLVLVHGELWKAKSIDGVVKEGEMVMVKEVNGLKLEVKKIKDGGE